MITYGTLHIIVKSCTILAESEILLEVADKFNNQIFEHEKNTFLIVSYFRNCIRSIDLDEVPTFCIQRCSFCHAYQ